MSNAASTDPTGPFSLYREDDNGARFLIQSFPARADAEARAAELARGGHKQHYFIEQGQPGSGAYRVISSLSPAQAEQLHALYQNEWWSAGRTLPEVLTMLEHTDFVFGVTPEGSEQLVAFARVLTDRAFKALLFDVIVHPDHRAGGLGSWLLTQITSHPVLSRVRHFELFCKPELEPYYNRWEFVSQTGDTVHMRRSRTQPS